MAEISLTTLAWGGLATNRTQGRITQRIPSFPPPEEDRLTRALSHARTPLSHKECEHTYRYKRELTHLVARQQVYPHDPVQPYILLKECDHDGPSPGGVLVVCWRCGGGGVCGGVCVVVCV